MRVFASCRLMAALLSISPLPCPGSGLMAFERMEGVEKREREEEWSSFLCGVSFVDPVVQ